LFEALGNTASDVLLVIGEAEMFNGVRGSEGGALSALGMRLEACGPEM